MNPLSNILNRIRTFAAETWQEWRGAIASIKEEINKKPDPKRHAIQPTENWHKATPEAPVPQRKTKAVEVHFDTYTLAEIEEMSESEYRIKVGGLGIGTREEMIKLLTKKERKKPERGNAIEL